MRVLMLGWEFPPYISGGLGTACYGLTKALSDVGTEILFVLPRAIVGAQPTSVRLLGPSSLLTEESARELRRVVIRAVPSHLTHPYAGLSPTLAPFLNKGKQAVRCTTPTREISELSRASSDYGGDLLAEVDRYMHICMDVARAESFDVIHAHDWMTYPAGLAISAQSGKPLVAHVHSTEFDRAGLRVNQRVYDIERRGMHGAAAVICVSRMTAAVARNRYNVPTEKIAVVYNGIDATPHWQSTSGTIRGEKVVLFLGRLTMQKGPEYFLAAAKKVLSVMDNVKFIVAGSGDKFGSTVALAAEMGIGHKALFAGFLRGNDVTRAFRKADLYVMPSVSEPFGITPLEAISNGVPVIISRSSGVSEVLKHALKVDFWDIDEMANKIVAVLRRPPIASTLRKHASAEIRKLTWDNAANACLQLYQVVCESVRAGGRFGPYESPVKSGGFVFI